MKARLGLLVFNMAILAATLLAFYLMYEVWEEVVRPDTDTGDTFGVRSLFGTLVIAPTYVVGLVLHDLVINALSARMHLSTRFVAVAASMLVGVLTWLVEGSIVQRAIFAVGIPVAFAVVMKLPDDRAIDFNRALVAGLMLVLASLLLALVV